MEESHKQNLKAERSAAFAPRRARQSKRNVTRTAYVSALVRFQELALYLEHLLFRRVLRECLNVPVGLRLGDSQTDKSLFVCTDRCSVTHCDCAVNP